MDIKVNVENQKLHVLGNLRRIISGSEQFIRFVFELPDDWLSINPNAQFIQDGTPYDVPLDEDNAAFLPNEITTGKFHMLLWGQSGNVIGVSNHITMTIDDNLLILDDE